MPDIGFVIIGRNEGERLRACLASVQKHASKIVYVDSGSVDNSCALAADMGVDVHPLDKSKPFSAARARNEGFAHITAKYPALDFVHFLDGDTVIVDTWLAAAVDALNDDPKSAVVSGRRRERHPEKSIFNRLCNIEWNKPVGKVWNFEGDALFRPQAFTQAGGFNATLIAGEEPEFCSRLRAKGWDILRIKDDMTWHDANMLRVGQWWKRESRAAYAYAESIAMYGSAYGLKRSLGILWWAFVLPVATLALAWPTRGISLLVALALYAVLTFRAYRGMRPRADSAWLGFEYAIFCVLGKWPMLQGYLQYWKRRLTGKQQQLIEYKGAQTVATEPIA
ncbi:MAG TPA: glycosyltransferase family A protein [Phycisphaerae bacterium]|jgi:glycosyltransferase involved in cell wall biosynthesis|nr:glycosyltransferase family A protein [Phycisphaerae bacterium]